MEAIHLLEDRIWNDWVAKARSFGDDTELVKDGLLYRGDIFFEGGCWHRKHADEEAKWNAASRKLLILTKDLNDDEAWDIREETGRTNSLVNSYEKAIPFYKNLRMWSYGLLNANTDTYPAYKVARDMNISGPFYEVAPIARVNCKKQIGSGSIEDEVLLQYMEKYHELLREQIALYDADVILCCGCASGVNLTLNFLKSQYLTDLEQVPDTKNWIYYSPSTGKMAINSYHPSARIGYEYPYYDMMEAFRTGLKQIEQNYGKII